MEKKEVKKEQKEIVSSSTKNPTAIAINKNVLILIGVAIIITILLSFLAFNYYPKYKKNLEIQEYKKTLFDSVLCQYSCPLSAQVFQNKSLMLPENECVQSCTQELRDKQTSGDKFSTEDLSKDDLVKDTGDLVKECQASSISKATGSPDSEIFFPCVKEKLLSLKQKYSYLN